MRNYTLLALSLALVSSSFAQAPSLKPSPEASPEKRKNFGSSLKRYDKEKGDWSPKAPPKSDDSDDEVIRVKTDLVVNDLLVVNQKGNPIIGLEQSDFLVTEDGVPQKISVFAFGENATIPRSIVLIIDYSGSQRPYIKNSIAAAKLLVDKLASQDRMAIVTDDVELLVDFTNDKALLKKELDNLGEKPLQGFGRSQQYTALVATLNEMFDEEDVRPIVIFQTDGDEFPSLKGSQRARPLKKFSFEDVYALVGKSRATVYSIISGLGLIGLSQEEQFSKIESLFNRKPSKDALINTVDVYLQLQMPLFAIAKLSGGYTDFLEKPEDAENVYSNIFKVINNRYLIGYYPTNKERDGKRRNVKIEVRNYPEYTVTGRTGYFVSQ